MSNFPHVFPLFIRQIVRVFLVGSFIHRKDSATNEHNGYTTDDDGKDVERVFVTAFTFDYGDSVVHLIEERHV